MNNCEMKERKRILLTGGPTNEPIDEVMKITNMSTGSFTTGIAKCFAEKGWQVVLILNESVHTKDLPEDIIVSKVDTTEEMMKALEEESKKEQYHVIIHAAAVGDYKTDFTFLMEDLAKEIFSKRNGFETWEDVYKLLTDPECRLDNSSKISSYQSDLSVKLCLTPKIIGSLKKWFPNSLLVGCKLLENVPKKELYGVAQALCQKNKMNFILANDLADLRKGVWNRYVVTKDGYIGRNLNSPQEVINFIAEHI